MSDTAQEPPVHSGCPECGGALHFFEPRTSHSVKPEDLPSACQSCHGIFLHGSRLALPADFERKAVSLAVQADSASKATLDRMKSDPELRVERYLSETFRTAYMTGFFRAMAYFQHQAKEGRLIRLAKLWAVIKRTMTWDQRAQKFMVDIPGELYAEFDQLLQVKTVTTTKGAAHVEGSANADPPRSTGQAPVLGPPPKEVGGGEGPGQ